MTDAARRPPSAPQLALRDYLIAAFLAVALSALPASASPESDAAVERGLSLLRAGAFEQALAAFQEAHLADPSDSDALFFAASALNRLARYQDAFETLQESRRRGGRHPDLDLEAGWSLVGIERWDEAIRVLVAYEAAWPGNARTMEFLGRAYYAQDRLDEAEDAFRRALARDETLTPTVHGYLALIAQKRGDTEGAQFQLEELFARAPESDLARRLREQAATDLDKSWWLNASVGFGYRDNAIALGDGTPRPADISRRSSSMTQLNLDAGYRWRIDDLGMLVAGYSAVSDIYFEGLSQFDTADNYFYAEYQRLVSDVLLLSLRLSDQYTAVGGDPFRNEVSLRPAMTVLLTPWLAVEAAYSFSFSDYFFGGPSVQDRDSLTHGLRLLTRMRIPGTELDFSVGSFVALADADGADFDLGSFGPILQFGHSMPFGAYGQVTYSHSFGVFDNANSLAGAGFAFNRKDSVDRLRVDLSLPVAEKVSLFARYELIRSVSNIPVFDFDQHTVLAGVAVRF